MGKLVWIASYPKSGNTWVRAFLHNYIKQPARPYDINKLTDLTASDVNAPRYQRYDPRPPSHYAIADVQRMRPQVHRDLMALDSTLVFVKTHNARKIVAGTPLITPEVTAGSIYIIRDPRDVAISYAAHLGRPVDEVITLMANPDAATGGTDEAIYELLSTWSAHVESWIQPESPYTRVLRYEDMIADPARVFAPLVTWLAKPPPPDRLAQAIAFSSFQELSQQEKTRGFRERVPQSTAPFFGQGRPGHWRDVLTPAQQAKIERDHGEMMQRLGYL